MTQARHRRPGRPAMESRLAFAPGAENEDPPGRVLPPDPPGLAGPAPWSDALLPVLARGLFDR